MVIDVVAPVAAYYGLRAAGASVWLALVAGAVVPAISVLAGVLTRRRIDAMGFLVLAAIAVSAAVSLVTGSPRDLLARDGLITGAWAGYMYVSLLARRPATFVVSRPLLEGRRVFDSRTRAWVRPASHGMSCGTACRGSG
ncbi:MAG: VC0807 family protein [Streptosporangiaceae bacterium]